MSDIFREVDEDLRRDQAVDLWKKYGSIFLSIAVLIVAGTLSTKMAGPLIRLWEQMPEPKWCVAMGDCTCSGGRYKRSYATVQGIDRVMPVDVYIPGCPPRPEGLIYGIMMLQKKVLNERNATPGLRNEMTPDPTSKLYIPPSRIDELSEPFGNSVHQTRSAP